MKALRNQAQRSLAYATRNDKCQSGDCERVNNNENINNNALSEREREMDSFRMCV